MIIIVNGTLNITVTILLILLIAVITIIYDQICIFLTIVNINKL